MVKHSVKLIEGRVTFDSKGRPIVHPPVHLAAFDVSARSLDDAMAKAKAKGKEISGGRLPAVSVCTECSPNGEYMLVATVRAR